MPKGRRCTSREPCSLVARSSRYRLAAQTIRTLLFTPRPSGSVTLSRNSPLLVWHKSGKANKAKANKKETERAEKQQRDVRRKKATRRIRVGHDANDGWRSRIPSFTPQYRAFRAEESIGDDPHRATLSTELQFPWLVE